MKPLNKRSMIVPKIRNHLKKTSDEKLIPEAKWESLKKAKEVK